MCSTTGARLARICRAIEELADHSGQEAGKRPGTSESAEATPTAGSCEAAESAGASRSADPNRSGETTAAGDRGAAAGERGAAAGEVARRLAEIWAMVADADPELAKRLPGYLGTE